MKLLVGAVGRLKAPYAIDGCTTFEKRLRRYFPVIHAETKDIKRRKSSNAHQVREDESGALLNLVPNGSLIVALDETGRQWRTAELASWLDEQKNRSVSAVSFLIGGPDGHGDRVRTKAHRLWSLSQLTLPHEMARLLLFEQLYRAASILHGHPYHRV
ncbi:MAG: 23S rRNA (pseudouridine(1915)-N(3))-methyltransferase RlmH [Myxococcota bacterium]|nr:23S rRNA (pseudouridine(1915)-N(3))-methyltransferase RlmH [Myxococcota bacterium]